MASAVDISNNALGLLGDDAAVTAISPPDGSVQAEHCARIYPMARDELLEMHNWKFAVKREALALLSTTELPADWAYAYALPSCIKPIAVYPSDTISVSPAGTIFDQDEFVAQPKAYPFTIESLDNGDVVVYTNVEDAVMSYVAPITDTAKFSPLFRAALARLMASYLAGPILKGKVGIAEQKNQIEIFEKIALPRAKAADANASHNPSYANFIPASLAARA